MHIDVTPFALNTKYVVEPNVQECTYSGLNSHLTKFSKNNVKIKAMI